MKAGCMQAWESLTLHAHNAHSAGQGIHMQAAPSQAEALMHEFKAKKEAATKKSKVCLRCLRHEAFAMGDHMPLDVLTWFSVAPSIACTRGHARVCMHECNARGGRCQTELGACRLKHTGTGLQAPCGARKVMPSCCDKQNPAVSCWPTRWTCRPHTSPSSPLDMHACAAC